jgi:hypothetical protein
MTAQKPQVGEIIESHCRRCNDRTGHAIVSFIDGAVAKVQCRACGSVHKHRAEKASTGGASSRSSKSKSKSRPKDHQQPAIDPRWQEQIETRDTHQAKPYSMDCQCVKNELLEHPRFGTGVVQELVAPNKVRVLFQEGEKLLRCASFEKR